jgi:hypothetical protein
MEFVLLLEADESDESRPVGLFLKNCNTLDLKEKIIVFERYHDCVLFLISLYLKEGCVLSWECISCIMHSFEWDILCTCINTNVDQNNDHHRLCIPSSGISVMSGRTLQSFNRVGPCILSSRTSRSLDLKSVAGEFRVGHPGSLD